MKEGTTTNFVLYGIGWYNQLGSQPRVVHMPIEINNLVQQL